MVWIALIKTKSGIKEIKVYFCLTSQARYVSGVLMWLFFSKWLVAQVPPLLLLCLLRVSPPCPCLYMWDGGREVEGTPFLCCR